MADITIAGSLIPSKVDTPLDKRSRVATLADVASIENPVLGGIFYCVATGKHYKITALKNKTMGALTVANAQVDSYEELVQVDATLEGRVSDVEAAISGKASASDLSTLAGRVSEAETALSGKASASDLSTLAGRVTDAEGTIAEHTTALEGKASASDVTALAGRVTQAETAIEGKADTSDLSGFAPADHTHNFGAMAEVTKFEVYATNEVITAGTVDSDTGLAYAVDVPAGMTHTFKLRSDTPQAQQDVSIDWGDGVISNLRSGDYDTLDDSEFDENGELVYTVSHSYATPGKYIVIISGKSYWGLQTLNSGSILSRIFASDLPIASWVKNLSNAAQYSPKLQKVMIPTGMDFFVNIHNASGLFSNCVNLLSATNFATKFQYTRYVQYMFNGCANMVTCDFRIPQNCIKANAYRSVYYGCAALTANIANLLPERGFDGTNLDITNIFRGCASLTGTVPAAILWEDMRIVWQNTANAFTGCSAAIRAQVPESWGGTGSEIEDPHPISRSQIGPVITSKVDEALQNLNIQSSGSNGVGNILGGYAARILAYEETTANNVTTYTLYLSPDTDEVDWTKFEVGQSVRISVPDATTETLLFAEIATIDSSNAKITLTAALNLPSGTTLGMEKRTVSGYTASATGGLTAYRVTYSGAGTDNELCEGRDVYTRAGSGAFVKNSIQGTLGNYIFLTSAATSGTNAIYLPPSNAILSVAVAEDDTICSASGEYNTVVGEASSADGAYNVVDGISSHVSGTDNKVFGSGSTVRGIENLVSGDNNYVFGGRNTVADGLNIVIGDQNTALRQGAVLIGDMNVALSVKNYAFGWGNTLKAYGGMAFGTSNTINGKWSISVGYRNTVNAESAYVVGRYADIPDAAENKNGFFIWGGHNDDNALAFSVRVFRAELNPLFNGATLWPGYTANDPNPKDSAGERKYNSVPAYRTEFKGQLKPTTQTIAISGSQTVTLDPTMYSRVMLTGSGTVTFDIEDYAEDGDKIQLVLDSNGITPVFPAAWVTLGADVSTDPGLYVLEIAKVQSTVFYKVLYPDSQGGGGDGQPGASAYEVALANGFSGTEAQWLASLKGAKGDTGAQGPQGEKGDIAICLCTDVPQSLYDGMIWIRGGTSTPQFFRAVTGVNVIAEADASGTLADGTIIITEVAQ